MLATLNLQFSPVEITDDSFLTPAMTPDLAPIAEFADLLRLQVDAVEAPATAAGQFLPQGGSELPLQALPLELDAPTTPELTVLPQTAELSTTPVGDLPRGAQALTPIVVKQAAEPLHPSSLAPEVEPGIAVAATPVVAAADPLPPMSLGTDLPQAVQPRPQPLVPPGIPHPAIPNEMQQAAPLAAKPEYTAPVLREPALLVQAQPAAAPDLDTSMPIVESPRRTEALPMPAANVEEISEVFKARPTVTQPVQVLNAQPNPQQVVVMPTAPTPVTTDTGFAAAVQQASDVIPVPVRDTAWAEQIGERVLMMAGKQTTSAEIRLTPAELGPLRVQVSVDDGAANVTFQAQHAVTREAIEQALPRLRELFAESGLTLGQASVGEQGVAEGKRDERSTSAQSAQGDAVEADEAGEADEARRVMTSDNLVDTFV